MAERKDLRDLLRDTDFTQKRIIDDLASSDIEPTSDRDMGRDIRRSEGSDFMRNFFVGVLLIAIVVGSFWISFLLGKKVLVPPVKNLQTIEEAAPKAISRSELETATPVKEENQEEAAIPENEPKQVEQNAGLPQPVERAKPKVVAAPAPVKTASSTTWYKVVIGTYRTNDDAAHASEILKANGFKAFIKKTALGYRVQTGAFATRELAVPMVNKLKAKGFNSRIIFE